MGTCGSTVDSTDDQWEISGEASEDIEAGDEPNHYFQNGQWIGHPDGRPFDMDSEGVPVDAKDYAMWLRQVSPANYTLPEGWRRVDTPEGTVLWFGPKHKEGQRMPPKMIPPQKRQENDKDPFKSRAHGQRGRT